MQINHNVCPWETANLHYNIKTIMVSIVNITYSLLELMSWPHRHDMISTSSDEPITSCEIQPQDLPLTFTFATPLALVVDNNWKRKEKKKSVHDYLYCKLTAIQDITYFDISCDVQALHSVEPCENMKSQNCLGLTPVISLWRMHRKDRGFIIYSVLLSSLPYFHHSLSFDSGKVVNFPPLITLVSLQSTLWLVNSCALTVNRISSGIF